MAPTPPPSPKRAPTPVTPPAQTNITSGIEPPAKRFAERTNERSATDYLVEQNRVVNYNSNPRRRHLFIQIKAQELFTALKTMYSHFFQVHSSRIGRALDGWSKKTAGSSSVYDHAAACHITHWLMDTYHTTRKSVKLVAPTAYLDKFSNQSVLFSDSYDHFLATLNAHLRPTYIISISDNVWIPTFSTNQMADPKNPFPDIKGLVVDNTLFLLIQQILENHKLCKMTNLSTDSMGRPSWLFDWYDDGTAYSWFMQEGNYNDVDVAVAYIVGGPISPKLGIYDADEWVIYPTKTTAKEIAAMHKHRASTRYWLGLSEVRQLEFQQIELPDYYEEDDAKREALNLGPLRLQTSSSSSTQDVDEDTVPQSPRVPSAIEKNKTFRARTLDRIYYAQVIMKSENSTRYAAFKIFNNYKP